MIKVVVLLFKTQVSNVHAMKTRKKIPFSSPISRKRRWKTLQLVRDSWFYSFFLTAFLAYTISLFHHQNISFLSSSFYTQANLSSCCRSCYFLLKTLKVRHTLRLAQAIDYDDGVSSVIFYRLMLGSSFLSSSTSSCVRFITYAIRSTSSHYNNHQLNLHPSNVKCHCTVGC